MTEKPRDRIKKEKTKMFGFELTANKHILAINKDKTQLLKRDKILKQVKYLLNDIRSVTRSQGGKRVFFRCGGTFRMLQTTRTKGMKPCCGGGGVWLHDPEMRERTTSLYQLSLLQKG